MSKQITVESAVDDILNETVVKSSIKPGESLFGDKGKLVKVKQPKIAKPTPIKNNECFGSTVQMKKNHRKCKGPLANFEEDSEETMMTDEAIKENILGMFNHINSSVNGLNINEIIRQIGRQGVARNKIYRILQELINKRTLISDEYTKKIYLNDEAEEDFKDDGMSDDELHDRVIDYFDRSVSGSIGGISPTKAVKDIAKEVEVEQSRVAKAITDLLKDKVLIRGVEDGTLIYNSADSIEMDNLGDDLDEAPEEDAETISVTIPGGGDAPQPINNQETPETLKMKGWEEITPGTYQSPDGNTKYSITVPMESFDNSSINKSMKYNSKSEFVRLCEEFEAAMDEIDTFDGEDSTDGLDEFDSETTESETPAEDTVTVEFTPEEVEVLKSICSKLGLSVSDDTDVEVTEDDIEDDFVDDEATDEEANAELMDDFDSDFEDEDEDNEDVLNFEIEDEDDWDFDEDEESVADSSSSVYDGSGRQGAATMTRTTPSYDKSGKPVTSKIKVSSGHGADAARSNGGATTTRTTPSYDKSGKPVKSRQTSKAGQNVSLFD